MDDEAKLELMKKRIVGSYAWQRDIIVPLSKDFDCTTDELEHIFFDLLDMSELENMHGRFETAQYLCLSKKLYADLKLCWFVDSMELISKDEADELTGRLVNEIIEGKDYSDILKEGQKELFTILKNSR